MPYGLFDYVPDSDIHTMGMRNPNREDGLWPYPKNNPPVLANGEVIPEQWWYDYQTKGNIDQFDPNSYRFQKGGTYTVPPPMPNTPSPSQQCCPCPSPTPPQKPSPTPPIEKYNPFLHDGDWWKFIGRGDPADATGTMKVIFGPPPAYGGTPQPPPAKIPELHPSKPYYDRTGNPWTLSPIPAKPPVSSGYGSGYLR